MAIFIKVNGVIKEIEQPYTKVDGQINETEVYTRVDGKPRLVFGKITAKDIVGFKMVYYVKKDAEYTDIPSLRYNGNLPVIMSVTSGAGILDENNKGVVYEYFDTNTTQEGILMYEGRLLAMLKNGMLLDIFGNPDPIPGLDAPLVTKAMDFTLVVSYDVRYQGYGIHTRGWNSMWSSYQFLKPDTENAEQLDLDVRSTANHVLVPIGDTNSCREWRAVGLKDLQYDKALQMVREVLSLPDNTDRSTYAKDKYPEKEVQCPGRTNYVMSYERASELWGIVQSNKTPVYNDGLFVRMCEAVGESVDNDTTCSIYSKCKLGYLTYRAAMGEPDCPEYENLHWPHMSLQHASDLYFLASKNSVSLNPEKVADDLFETEPIYCSGRDVPPLGYLMASVLFSAVWRRKDRSFNDEIVYEIFDELGLIEEVDDSCSIYGTCRYDSVTYNQALYFATCDPVDITTDNDVIPEDTSAICEIGIARSMRLKDHHMQGSRGVMSQNIYSVKLDGLTVPFTVQVMQESD